MTLSFLLLPAPRLLAQDEPAPADPAVEPEPAAEPVEEAAADEPSLSNPRITFHGYLTQAYTQSDGFTILGIPEDGTADYRTAAVQIRADISENDAFVVQFSHERFGNSRVQEIKDDVELDWIFYERHFGPTVVKVGRVQIPFGIYSEVRDVGTVLPFYRPSHNFYGEAAYSSETVDGLVVSRDFQLGPAWRLEADLHYGNWQFIQRDFITGDFRADEVDDSIGIQLWLDTPLPGLRIGGGYMEYHIQIPGAEEAPWDTIQAGLSLERERFSFHAEAKTTYIGAGDVHLGYAHLGVNLTDRITLNAQQDLFYLELDGTPRTKIDDDLALGLNYAFSSAVVLKAEHHWNEGSFWLEDAPPPLPGAAVPETRYFLLSLSTAF